MAGNSRAAAKSASRKLSEAANSECSEDEEDAYSFKEEDALKSDALSDEDSDNIDEKFIQKESIQKAKKKSPTTPSNSKTTKSTSNNTSKKKETSGKIIDVKATKQVSTGPTRRVGLSRSKAPKAPPSPVRIVKTG